jgi:hypothetical protein
MFMNTPPEFLGLQVEHRPHICPPSHPLKSRDLCGSFVAMHSQLAEDFGARKQKLNAPTAVGQRTSGTWHSTARLPNIYVKWYLRSGGRCSRSYEGKTTPSAVTANEVWVEFTNSIMARINHIKAKATWWSYQDEVWLVPKAVATLHLEEIEA